jgi:hypothetical protein
MINHIIDAILGLVGVTLSVIAFGSFIFMWFVFYNGYIFAGLLLLVLSIMSYASMTWLVENGWRFRR